VTAPTSDREACTTPCARDHLDELITAARGFGPCVDLADRWGTRLAAVLDAGGRLLAAGNGGSAAQAQHLTAELVGRYRHDRPPEELFARQVEAHGRPGDVLVLMSTSGRSPNIVAAAERGRHVGLQVWSFTGPGPNPLADAADEALCADATYTATVQELHLVALHALCAGLDRELGVDPASVA
jgi:D-sedoheptulose 7-phosphate isomerase